MSEITPDSQNKKARLGRGLGSLFGEQAGLRSESAPAAVAQSTVASSTVAPSPASSNALKTGPSLPTTEKQETVPPGSRIWTVAIDKLVPSSVQPRRYFEKAKLEELAQSIKSSGLLQPILTRRKSDGTFEIIAGERRWRASQLAGLHEVPVMVRDFDEVTALEVALIENIQREDLNPIEEAEAYSRLATEFKLTQVQVAEKVGKDRATVANSIRLLQLDTTVKNLIIGGELSVGHAKVLLSVPQASVQKELAQQVIDKKLTVRKLEQLIKNSGAEPKEASAPQSAIRTTLIQNLADQVQKALSTKVTIDYVGGKGKINIHFYSDDELTAITDRLKGS